MRHLSSSHCHSQLRHGSGKLPAKGQHFIGAETAVSCARQLKLYQAFFVRFVFITATLHTPAQIKPKSFESRRPSPPHPFFFSYFSFHPADTPCVYVRAWTVCCFHRLNSTQTPSTGLRHLFFKHCRINVSYAIGSGNLSANEHFFVGAQTVESLLQTTQIISDVCFILPCCLRQLR